MLDSISALSFIDRAFLNPFVFQDGPSLLFFILKFPQLRTPPPLFLFFCCCFLLLPETFRTHSILLSIDVIAYNGASPTVELDQGTGCLPHGRRCGASDCSCQHCRGSPYGCWVLCIAGLYLRGVTPDTCCIMRRSPGLLYGTSASIAVPAHPV